MSKTSQLSRRGFFERVARFHNITITGLPAPYAQPDPHYGALPHDEQVLTPAAAFFSVHLGTIPPIDRDRWTLTLDGLVARPLTLDWRAIEALPPVEDVRTVASIANPVGGPLIGTARWRGVALAPLLTHVGVKPAATHACFFGADGYATTVDLGRLARGSALLAFAMNGASLPPAQGYPLRALVPGVYDHKMPKWLTRIALVDRAYPGYWERHGWSSEATVKTHALFRTPPARAEITGAIYLQGIAFAGDRAVRRVEVSADEGPWLEAALRPPESPLAWTPWHFHWQPSAPGVYTFRVRATDAAGVTQRAEARPPFPDGADGIHRLTLTVR